MRLGCSDSRRATSREPRLALVLPTRSRMRMRSLVSLAL